MELSPRQAEILRLLADALTTVEIGERLEVSPRQWRRTCGPSTASSASASRTAAARCAVEHGLAGTPD